MKSPFYRLQEHVDSYKLITELAGAPTGLRCGNLLRGDANEARKVLKPSLSRNSTKVRSLVLSAAFGLPLRTTVVFMSIYRTETHGILDTGAVPDRITETLYRQLTFMPTETSRKGTAADGNVADVLGCVEGVSVSF